MLSRIARHSRQTISASFDGGATSPVTVEVLDEAGGEVVPAATATVADGGSHSFELTPAQTAELGRLTAIWTDGAGVRQTTFHDVVGFHLISLDRLRDFEPLDDATNYSDEMLALGRDIATYALERACNRAFAPRLARETITARGGRTLPLAAGPKELVSVASQDGGEVDLDGILLDPTGYLERPNGSWTRGSSYLVSYIHGEQAVDPRVSRAVGLIAADLLFSDLPDGQGSAIPDRATSLSTAEGTFSLVTAGMGSSFSLPEVNAVVQQWRLPS